MLTPILALALARRIREPRAWAVALPLAAASAQILVAIDTQRLVAAAYPYVLLACAWELDRLPPRRQPAAAVLVVLAQLPWLLANARTWPVPTRGIEIVLIVLALAAFVYGAIHSRPAPTEP